MSVNRWHNRPSRSTLDSRRSSALPTKQLNNRTTKASPSKMDTSRTCRKRLVTISTLSTTTAILSIRTMDTSAQHPLHHQQAACPTAHQTPTATLLPSIEAKNRLRIALITTTRTRRRSDLKPSTHSHLPLPRITRAMINSRLLTL